jgi:hypothetical protein
MLRASFQRCLNDLDDLDDFVGEATGIGELGMVSKPEQYLGIFRMKIHKQLLWGSP